MIRVYVTTTVEQTRQILSSGFTDIHSWGDAEGVFVAKQPLDANDGFDGDVVLSVTIPVEVFDDYEELIETGTQEVRSGRALVPAKVLNEYGLAQIYDHVSP